MNSLSDFCREITWGQLAGLSSRKAVNEGRRIQQKGAVSGLRETGGGRGVLAWVDAEELFAVLIEIEEGELVCSCTCNPLVDICEHSVAVIIEYIVHLKRGAGIAAAEKNDPRLHLI